MDKNKVILVDKEDNIIGLMEKMEAHKKALLHRAVSVFIFNTKGQWLLQRRAMEKYHSAGLWTNTCCTHPFSAETYPEAANRRLKEEMGMEAELTDIFNFIYKEKLDDQLSEHELDHVFVGITDKTPIPEPNEVMQWQYIDSEDLFNDINNNPENYTVWFKKIVSRVHKNISQND